MVMSLPGRVLALGMNMDEPFPPQLRELHDADLVALLANVEPAAGARDDTGAHDWSLFGQRMHYIAHLFRAYHLHDELLGPAFTERQVLAFTAGTIPDGDL